MRGSSTLHRALAQVTVDSHRQIRARDKQATHYELAEREQQFQLDISGSVGSNIPAETSKKILFDQIFVWDAGVRRDSQLGEPLVRFGFTLTNAPKGTVPYAYVSSWIQDDDLNYVGANVTIAVHNPTDAIGKYAGTLHCSFQGYGMPLDTQGSGDAGADTGNDNDSSSNGSGGTGSSSGPGSQGSGGPSGGGDQVPAYTAGPLGGSSWSLVHSWQPHGALEDFIVPAGEGRLEVAGDDGRLTTADPHQVLITGPAPGYVGDKYAAAWIAPGRQGGGHKVRAHFLLNMDIDDYLTVIGGVVLNMQDRQRGLGFWFGSEGIGWTTDLRLLGTVQYLGQAKFIGRHQRPSPGGQDVDLGLIPTSDLNPYATRARAAAGVISPEQENALRKFCGAWLTTRELWVELWRDGDALIAALYKGDPDSGTKPSYVSAYSVKDDPHFGPGVAGHFGWTLSYIQPGPPWWRIYPKRGIFGMKLFKES